MRKTKTIVPSVLFFLPLAPAPAAQRGATAAKPRQGLVRRIVTVRQQGGRLDWGRNGRSAFDQMGPHGHFEVYTMTPDGSDVRCLTCNTPGLPQGHRGNPAWHPSGRYIVLQAQIPPGSLVGPRLRPLIDFFANPGSGLGNTLFLIDSEGRQSWELVPLRSREGGVLHPHFSARGNLLFWSEHITRRGGPWGTWALHIADFHANGGAPRVENIRTLQPGAQHRFYESHGFSPDGRVILFSGNCEPGQKETALDIYTFDLVSKTLRNLTKTPEEWDEHAHFSPDGRKIVWMSSRDIGLPGNPADLKSDYWIMNADGSGQQRLTWFNDPTSPDAIPGGVAAADFDWSPDGRQLMAYLIEDSRKVRGRIVRIELE